MNRPSIEKGDIYPAKFFRNHRCIMRLSGFLLLLVSPVLFPILICIDHKQDIKDLYVDVVQAIVHKK